MIELQDWLKYIKDHPLKFRFDGLHSRGRSSKNDFFTNVCEAAMADEEFISQRRCDEYESHEEIFDRSVETKEDSEDYLARFCEYVECHVSHRAWVATGLHTYEWRKAPIEELLKVVEFFAPAHKDSYLWDWCVGDVEVGDWEAEELLKKHPPIAAWNNAGDFEVKLEDIFFLCPSCRDPQLEDVLGECYTRQNGYPYFACGACGSEMSVGRRDNILDFFNALEITPYPFNREKQERWKKLMSDRKALGENKLEIKVGDIVHLEASELLKSEHGGGDWVHYRREPGDLVRCTETNEKSMSYEYVDGSGHGGITWDHVWSKAATDAVC